MRRLGLLVLICLIALTVTSHAPRIVSGATVAKAPETRHELIVVYIGVSGTNMDERWWSLIQGMKDSVRARAAATSRKLVTRGVSLEPRVQDGLVDLGHLGAFDEISVGGNWTNSSVVRYLGPVMGLNSESAIPQIVLLERDVTLAEPERLEIGPERQLRRFIGTKEIQDWIRNGTPVPGR